MLHTRNEGSENAQERPLAAVLPDWLRRVPLYQGSASPAQFEQAAAVKANLGRLPLITKREIRDGFPKNFLGTGASFDSLVEEGVIELEHTAGTSEERTPLLLPKGWWAEQEARALRLNAQVAAVLVGLWIWSRIPGRRTG